jgi:tRNA pseudouridine55 synthase
VVETINGFLIVDKPGGMTSRSAVNRIQRQVARRTKIGHTGTLDPLATGVLVLCLGAATKLADRVQALGKSYETRIRLGATSDTDDADGEITSVPHGEPIPLDKLHNALTTFSGTIRQTPPAYSAIKVDGQRSYDLARRGQAKELTARPVAIHRIELRKYDWPFVELTIECGKGTYIRSIARDLGQLLGVGGLVETLRRTRVGPFAAEQGIGVDADFETIRANLIPPSILPDSNPAR